MKPRKKEATQPVEKHRGISVNDLPHPRGNTRRVVWAMFRRGLWPPRQWRIPPTLEGPELAQALKEKTQTFKNGHTSSSRKPAAAPAEVVAAGIPHSQPERDQGASLGAVPPAETGSRRRIIVQFTRVTVSPLDADNHAGSVKAGLDCLRQAFPEILPDDNPEVIDLRLVQERCATLDEQGTWIHLWEAEAMK